MNAIQEHAKSITESISSPMYNHPVKVYITPPNPGELKGPAAYIWVTMGNVTRQTAPRGAGFLNTDWTVNVWLMAAGKASAATADRAFANLNDLVAKIWYTTPMPVAIVDPDTNEVTHITSIGEEYTVEQSPVRALRDQNLYLWESLFRFTVKEKTQG